METYAKTFHLMLKPTTERKQDQDIFFYLLEKRYSMLICSSTDQVYDNIVI